MRLYVIRHAEAVARSEGLPDAARPLTRKGRARWKRATRGLARAGVAFDHLFHSPWLRALETADGLHKLVEQETIVTRHLAGPPSPELLQLLHGDSCAVVGHQPWLGELIAWLTIGDAQHGVSFELQKGSVAWLEGNPQPGQMTLRALFTPAILRRAGR
jgi:phosphohistidine phosphatase